jgi:hypothetical protein
MDTRVKPAYDIYRYCVYFISDSRAA